jgi:AraC family transcriptional regulator
VFEYIFSEWMPKSMFKIDDRPHFEVLGNKYRNNVKDSEEEIWIPIIEK